MAVQIIPALIKAFKVAGSISALGDNVASNTNEDASFRNAVIQPAQSIYNLMANKQKISSSGIRRAFYDNPSNVPTQTQP